MKVKELIKNLDGLKSELKEKDIFVMGENDLNIPPEIKFIMNDYSKLDKSVKNVDYIVLRW